MAQSYLDATEHTASRRRARRDTIKEPPEHWSRQQIAIGAVLWAVGLVVLAILSFFAHRYAEFPYDLPVAEWVQQLKQPLVDRIINFASDANWPTPAGIIAIAVILALLALRRVRAAICAVIAGFGADLVNVVLNGIVARPRPNNVHIHAVAHLGLHSYPSGHVTHVVAFYGFIFYLCLEAARQHPRWTPLWRTIQVVCVYFILFIGPSRVLEGEHWPSDVLASYLLGALMLTLAIALYHLLSLVWERYRSGQLRLAPAH